MQTQTNDARHKQKTKTDAAYTETKKHRERAAQKSDQGSLKIWCDDDDQGKQQEKGALQEDPGGGAQVDHPGILSGHHHLSGILDGIWLFEVHQRVLSEHLGTAQNLPL